MLRQPATNPKKCPGALDDGCEFNKPATPKGGRCRECRKIRNRIKTREASQAKRAQGIIRLEHRPAHGPGVQAEINEARAVEPERTGHSFFLRIINEHIRMAL